MTNTVQIWNISTVLWLAVMESAKFLDGLPFKLIKLHRHNVTKWTTWPDHYFIWVSWTVSGGLSRGEFDNINATVLNTTQCITMGAKPCTRPMLKLSSQGRNVNRNITITMNWPDSPDWDTHCESLRSECAWAMIDWVSKLTLADGLDNINNFRIRC